MSLDSYVNDLWVYAQSLGYDRVDASSTVEEAAAGGGLAGIPSSLYREFVPGKDLFLTFWSTRRPGMAARVVLDVPGEGEAFDEGRAEGDRKFLAEMMGKRKND